MLKKEKISQFNNSIFQFKKIEKDEQTNPKQAKGKKS